MCIRDSPNLTDADRWRMRFDPDSEARARIFGYLGRRLGPGSPAAATAGPPVLQRAPDAATAQYDMPYQHHSHYPTNLMEPR